MPSENLPPHGRSFPDATTGFNRNARTVFCVPFTLDSSDSLDWEHALQKQEQCTNLLWSELHRLEDLGGALHLLRSSRAILSGQQWHCTHHL